MARAWKIPFTVAVCMIVLFAQTPNSQGDPAVNQLVTIIQTTYTPGNLASIIGELRVPSTVYPNKYLLLDTTINDSDSIAQFVNATVELSNGIVLKWENMSTSKKENQE